MFSNKFNSLKTQINQAPTKRAKQTRMNVILWIPDIFPPQYLWFYLFKSHFESVFDFILKKVQTQINETSEKYSLSPKHSHVISSKLVVEFFKNSMLFFFMAVNCPSALVESKEAVFAAEFKHGFVFRSSMCFVNQRFWN